jgi:hypothetical protein
MAHETEHNPAEAFLSKTQSASIDAIGAREARRPRRISVSREELNAAVGWMHVNGYLKEQRLVVIHAFEEYRKVAAEVLPVPVERTADTEPFFLP